MSGGIDFRLTGQGIGYRFLQGRVKGGVTK